MSRHHRQRVILQVSDSATAATIEFARYLQSSLNMGTKYTARVRIGDDDSDLTPVDDPRVISAIMVVQISVDDQQNHQPPQQAA